MPDPSVALQVIVAVPLAIAFTTPLEETVATAVFEEVHVTAVMVAFAGATLAVRVFVLPIHKFPT